MMSLSVNMFKVSTFICIFTQSVWQEDGTFGGDLRNAHSIDA